MFYRLDDRMHSRRSLVFLLYGMFELVSMDISPWFPIFGQGTFVYFVKLSFLDLVFGFVQQAHAILYIKP